MQKILTIRMEDKSASYNPWSQLTTVTTFDRGNNIRTTQRLNSSNTIDDNKQIMVTPLSQTLLIEALVKQICDRVEHTKERRNKLFTAICDELHKLHLMEGVYKMRDLQPYRSAVNKAFGRIFDVAHATSVGDRLCLIERPLCTQSRYASDFEERDFIAGGGFGKVYKALHRLDDVEYAIKKVVLSSNKIDTIVGYTAEAKTYAKLNHPNIVPYKSAWVEPIFNAVRDGAVITSIDLDDRLDVDQDNSNSGDSQDDSDDKSSSGCSGTSENDGNEEASSTDESCDDENSHSVSFRNNTKPADIQESYSKTSLPDSNNDSDFSEDPNAENRMRVYRPTHAYAMLYIQMALCGPTLQEWHKSTTGRIPPPIITEIVVQIFQALKYINSEGIIHHDVKPSNIFISSSDPLTIKLGDFGLACRSQSKHHSIIGGTPLYVAPEQSEGKCNRKSDVYSAGVVLSELLVPTTTRMELAKVIEAFKKWQLPASLPVDYSKLAQLASQLVQDDPKKRPSPCQVLEAISKDKDTVIAELNNKLQEKENIIKEKENTIEELRARVLMLEAKINSSTSQP